MKRALRLRPASPQAARSRTADLFAPAVKPKLEVALPLPQRGSSLAKQLWYAVVFPELTDAVLATSELQRLCLQAQKFTSFVSIEPPNALLLEIKGSVKLFGSLEALHAQIDAGWHGLALKAQSATAPSTLAALWCARAVKPADDNPTTPTLIEDVQLLSGHLAKLPLACTSWDEEHLQTLRSMGLRRIGELLRLPRAGLARRLGKAVLLDLDIALGKQAAPRRAFVPRERFRERCDFESEIEHVAYLEKALEPLIERCSQFLRKRQAGVQRLQLKLRHRTLPITRVQFGLASITSERRRLTDVFAQKLARLELKAPVRGMELISGTLQVLSAGSLDAFAGLSGTGGRDTVPQLVERLRARLGENAVYGVCLISEHRPEAAWRRVQELQLTGAAAGSELKTLNKMPRPVWLLEEPLPLSDGLILEEGPERIESGWWDGKGVARDYYIARQGHGERLWVFQERQSKRWYLHGVFA